MKQPKQRLLRILTIGLVGILCLTGMFTAPAIDSVGTPNATILSAMSTEPVAAISVPKLILFATEPVQTVQIPIQTEVITASEEVEVIEVTIDRTKPIYEVYKNGAHIYNDPNISWLRNVDTSAEMQWMIRDFATEYGFDEKFIYGVILVETCFQPKLKGDGERSFGLCQINRYWLSQNATDAGVPRFTEDYKSRDLLNPNDNLLTLMEIWTYAINHHDIDLSTEQGYIDLYYWHNTGQYRKNVNWAGSRTVLRHAAELVEIEY